MATKESLADLIAVVIADGKTVQMLFDGFSSAQISAMLQFGASKAELQQMFENSPFSVRNQLDRIADGYQVTKTGDPDNNISGLYVATKAGK